MVKPIYFQQAFTDREKVIRRASAYVEHLQTTDQLPKKLSIAFRGMSGAVVAPVLAYICDLGLIVVRKENDSSHSTRRVEGELAHDYIIVDDFISAGYTVDAIINAISKVSEVRCLGVMTYSRDYEMTYNSSMGELPTWFVGAISDDRPNVDCDD